MHMGIPVCKRAGIAENFAYGDPITHNEIVRIRGLTSISEDSVRDPQTLISLESCEGISFLHVLLVWGVNLASLLIKMCQS